MKCNVLSADRKIIVVMMKLHLHVPTCTYVTSAKFAYIQTLNFTARILHWVRKGKNRRELRCVLQNRTEQTECGNIFVDKWCRLCDWWSVFKKTLLWFLWRRSQSFQNPLQMDCVRTRPKDVAFFLQKRNIILKNTQNIIVLHTN